MDVFLNVYFGKNKQNSPQTQNCYMQLLSGCFWKETVRKILDGFHQILELLFSKKEKSICI